MSASASLAVRQLLLQVVQTKRYSDAARGGTVDDSTGRYQRLLPFEGVSFDGVHIPGADLTMCRFVDCSFQGANLTCVNFTHVSFAHVDFTNVFLSEAVFGCQHTLHDKRWWDLLR